MKKIFGGKTGLVLLLLVVLLLAGLPMAVWFDLTNLTETNLSRQASDLNSILSSVRSYYASNVVGRILAAPSVPTEVTHNYEAIPGAIPIPATLSLELGKVISERQHNITYRFVSDYPFANRAPHPLDEFEADALRRLRENPNQMISSDTTSLFSDQVRLVAPVVMGAPCVACHNSHPESPKNDWKVGDVRGLQEVTIAQPIGTDLFAFKYLLAYFVLVAAVGFIFIVLQRRQAALIQAMNGELETAITNPNLWRAAYATIIAAEALTALLLTIGAVALVRRLGAPAEAFNRAKGFSGRRPDGRPFFGFLVVGREYLAM